MIKIGNTYFNKEAKSFTLKEFKELYRGKLNIDLKEAHAKLKKSK